MHVLSSPWRIRQDSTPFVGASNSFVLIVVDRVSRSNAEARRLADFIA